MNDNRMKKGRVKALFGGAPENGLMDQPPEGPDPDAQRQSLQVLIMAQRTAEEAVADAHRKSERIQAEARAAAEQIVRDAQAHADGTRREADRALADARATGDQIVREAQAHADGARRDAGKVLSDARAQAAEIAKHAQANADELEREAQQRYQEAVGGLAAKRSALQQQIEALQQFDREYRARLRSFMQDQLRTLDIEEPPPTAEVQPDAMETTGPPAAQE